MRQASQELLDLLQSDSARNFTNYIEVYRPEIGDNDTLVIALDADMIRLGGNTFTDDLMDSDNFTVGNTVAKTASFTKEGASGKGSFRGCYFVYSIKIHFDEPTPHDEYITIGEFYITKVTINDYTTVVDGVDYMRYFDYQADMQSLGSPSLPEDYIPPEELLKFICQTCGVKIATDAGYYYSDYFPDGISIKRSTWDEICGNYTYRQMVGFLAQMAGCNARINANGRLEFIRLLPEYYEDEEYTPLIPPYDLTSAKNVRVDDFIRLTGVNVVMTNIKQSENPGQGYHYTDTFSVLVGTSSYPIVIENNPLIEYDGYGSIEGEDAYKIARHIAYNLGIIDREGERINPPRFFINTFSLSCPANPIIESGDWVKVQDIKGHEYISMVTNVQFTTGGYTQVSSKAQPPENKQFVQSSFSSRQKSTMARETGQQIDNYYNKRITYDTQDIQVGDDLPTGNLYLVYED